MLNRKDPVPLYVQLYRKLKQDIIKGVYTNGEMIPSETQLMKQYNVTRTTIRKAVSTLAQEGLVETLHGIGTVVSLRELKYSVWNFSGFTDYLRLHNETPQSVVLENYITHIDGIQYFRLMRGRGVKKDGDIVYLTLDDSLIPVDLFPGIDRYDFSTESLYDVMKNEYKLIPDHVNIQVIPIMGNDITEKLFKIDQSTPLLKVEGCLFTEEGIELEKIKLIYSPNMDFNVISNIGNRQKR